jgi:excinuclease ABC subunit B
VEGEVILYADTITGSMDRAIKETDRRRKKQIEYNTKHNIVPTTIIKEIKDIIPTESILELESKPLPKDKTSLTSLIKNKEKDMREAAKMLDFETAAILRDEIAVLDKQRKKL